MDLGIAGKRALIMGASRGIGRGIAEALAAEGVGVILCSRDGDKCAAVADEISEKYGVEAHGIACDLADPAAIDRAADFARDSFGGVDILANNTGGPPFGDISGVDIETWRTQFATMVLSVFRLTGHFLPRMRERQWGRILIVTSTGVVEPIPELGISNTLRVSLANWAKTLSFEIARDNVTINLLMPGRIGTERLEQFYASIPNAPASRSKRSKPMSPRRSPWAVSAASRNSPPWRHSWPARTPAISPARRPPSTAA